MTASFIENYNGYWVSAQDRKPRNFLWQNMMIADSQLAIFVAQTLGVGRGAVKVKLTFDGLIDCAEGEGVWIYDRDRWFWRVRFNDAEGNPYVFITFKEPRGAVPYETFRKSVFGVLYDRKGIVGYVRWRITFKEVSRLYKTIRPFQSEALNRLYRTLLVYPTILTVAPAYSLLSWSAELVRSAAAYASTFYVGELVSPDFARSDYLTPYPHEIGLSNDIDIDLECDWPNPV